MADIVLGKNYLLTAYQTDGYYPLACLQEVRLSIETELIPSTHYNSAVWSAVQPRRSSWSLSVSGVHILRDLAATKVFALDLIRDQVRTTGLDIRLVMQDEGGYTRTLEGHIYIPLTEFTGTAGQISKFSSEWQGSGTLTLDGAITINTSNVEPLEFTTTAGQTTYSNPLLVGVRLLWVDREDSVQQIITSGTPAGRQVLHDDSAGTLTFPESVNGGEFIKLLYDS